MKREPNAQSIYIRFDNSSIITEMVVGPIVNPETGMKKFFDSSDPHCRAIFTSRFADFVDVEGNVIVISMANVVMMKICPPFYKGPTR